MHSAIVACLQAPGQPYLQHHTIRDPAQVMHQGSHPKKNYGFHLLYHHCINHRHIRKNLKDVKKELSEISMMDEFAQYAKTERKINKVHCTQLHRQTQYTAHQPFSEKATFHKFYTLSTNYCSLDLYKPFLKLLFGCQTSPSGQTLPTC